MDCFNNQQQQLHIGYIYNTWPFLHCSKKTSNVHLFTFLNNSVETKQILRKFDMNILQICPPQLSDVAIFTSENPKSHFQHYYSYILLIHNHSNVKFIQESLY